MTEADVVILGAGLAGLVAARTIDAAGRSVVVVDKGRSVGGRLATRRIGDGRLDHGAQFFTVRGDDFRRFTDDALDAGVVYEWCRGFEDPEDGHPRYAGTGGMNGLAKWLAEGLSGPIDLATEIDAVEIAPDGVRLLVGGEVRHRAPVGILTAPIPQTLRLLANGDTNVDPAVAEALNGVDYFATLALLAVLDGAPDVGGPGGEQHGSGPFTFVADNGRKGISPVPALTAHADHDYSRRRYDDPGDEVLADLIELAEPWIAGRTVLDAQLKKWRYAGPVEPVPDRCLVHEGRGGRLLFAGDAFGGPKVEGAFASGRAAATTALPGTAPLPAI